MVSSIFAKKPQTRISTFTELNKIVIYLDSLENKEKELNLAGKKNGAGSIDFRKHVIVKKLWDELKSYQVEFNKEKSHKSSIQNKQDIIKLVEKMYQAVDKTLSTFSHTLNLSRNQQRENLNSAINYGSYALAFMSACYLSLSTFGTLFTLFYLTPKAKNIIHQWIGFTTDETATMILLKAFAKELIQTGENLGLAKSWQLKHSNENNLDFEDEIICPINRTIMREPMFCLLDERTYEGEAIRKWLNQHRTSPFNPSAKLPADKNADAVLKLNRNLKNVIETLHKIHPEYWDAEQDQPRMKVG